MSFLKGQSNKSETFIDNFTYRENALQIFSFYFILPLETFGIKINMKHKNYVQQKFQFLMQIEIFFPCLHIFSRCLNFISDI